MRANANANVERTFERDSCRGASDLQVVPNGGERQIHVLPVFLQTQPCRGRKVGLDFVGIGTFDITILERGKPVAMKRHVGVGRIGIETLSEDQNGLAMFVSSGAEEGDIGGEGNVAGKFLPDEVKGVGTGPHCSGHSR